MKISAVIRFRALKTSWEDSVDVDEFNPHWKQLGVQIFQILIPSSTNKVWRLSCIGTGIIHIRYMPTLFWISQPFFQVVECTPIFRRHYYISRCDLLVKYDSIHKPLLHIYTDEPQIVMYPKIGYLMAGTFKEHDLDLSLKRHIFECEISTYLFEIHLILLALCKFNFITILYILFYITFITIIYVSLYYFLHIISIIYFLLLLLYNTRRTS